MQRSLRLLLALLVAGALGGTSAALAQQEITGVVTDAVTNESLPGANVAVPGTTVGTATDINGEYTLVVPETADSLRFSFVGYQPLTVGIDGRTRIDVGLESMARELEDLVVIGYGEVEERDVTGAVQRVDPEDFNTAAAVSPEQIIAGKVPGVQISANDGAPGGGNTIRIRGATTVSAGNDPLFVIDGVPIINEGVQGTRNPLNFLNPNDIQSVTVLKDASATAIYGSRGANGVIIIQTKSGEEGDPQITYNGEFLAQSVMSRIDVLDADRFREVVAEQEPDVLPRLGIASTDWQDLVERPGYGQRHDLSISRGYEDADLRLSVNFLDQDGVIEASSTQRLAAAINYNQRLFDDALTINTSLRGAQTEDQFEPGVVGGAASFDPTQPVRLVGSPYGGFYEWETQQAGNNPVAEYILRDETGTTHRALGSVDARYEIPGIEGLSLRSVIGFDVMTGEREVFAPTFLKAQAENDNPGLIERRTFSRVNQLLDVFANYDRAFDAIDSEFDFTAGYSFQELNEEYPEFTGTGLTTNIFGPNNFDAVNDPANFTAYVNEIPSRLISTFGRVNYRFKDRYLLTFTVRRDGSSRFGPGNQWGTFPSAAFGWRVDEEPFMQNVDFLTSLKLRASWGVTGNQDFDDFLYEPFYRLGGPSAQVQFGDRFINTLRPAAADENLKWEETIATNVGFDYGLFNGRLTGDFNYYYSETDDLLFEVFAAGGTNLGDRFITNIGSVRNEGFEFGLNAFLVDTEHFSYTAQLNASTNDNEVLTITGVELGEGERITLLRGGISGGVGINVQAVREGEPINSFFLYEHLEDENGDPIYADVDGDGAINEQDLYRDVNEDGIVNEDDRVINGNPSPDWVIGHTSQFRYRALDLSFTLRAHIGNDVYNNVASNYGHYSRLTDFAPSNLHESALEYGFDEPQYLSDVYLEDGSFLRMDNISLGYTLRSLPSVGQVRLYGSVSNVFVLTGYDGTDPEIGVSGIDNNIYPRARTFTGGVEIRF